MIDFVIVEKSVNRASTSDLIKEWNNGSFLLGRRTVALLNVPCQRVTGLLLSQGLILRDSKL